MKLWKYIVFFDLFYLSVLDSFINGFVDNNYEYVFFKLFFWWVFGGFRKKSFRILVGDVKNWRLSGWG